MITMKKENFMQKCIRHLRCLFEPESQVQMYKRLGVVIGNNCDIISSSIDCTFPELIQIGDNVTITHATLLAHDASTKRNLGLTKFGSVKVGSNVFIGWGSIVLPNVRIGDNCIIGAGSVVNKDIPSNSVVIGNPGRIVCTYDTYIEKNKERLNTSLVCKAYPNSFFGEKRYFIIDNLMNGGGYFL